MNETTAISAISAPARFSMMLEASPYAGPLKGAMKNYAKGQKVRDRFGCTLTVLFQDGLRVHVEESLRQYHPAKLFAI